MDNKIDFFGGGDIDFLRSEVAEKGLVFFEENFSYNSYLEFAKNFGKIYLHRDSLQNGITVVSSEKNTSKGLDGYLGLTSSFLPLHTDRAVMRKPPNLLFLFCKESANVGGESILVDIQPVFKKLQKRYQENSPLVAKNSVIFSDKKNFFKGSIIQSLSNHHYFLRFRDDSFSYFNRKLIDFLPEFYSVIDDYTYKLKLSKNHGYIINNGRFLHGRTSFEGKRELWRLLVYDNFLKSKGFQI